MWKTVNFVVEMKLNIDVHCVQIEFATFVQNQLMLMESATTRKMIVWGNALFTYFGKTKEDDQEKVLTSTCIGYNENGHTNESNPDETVKISVSTYSEKIGSTLTHGHVVDSIKTISQHRKNVLGEKENVFVNVENKSAKIDKTNDTLSKKTILAADQIANGTTKNEIFDYI